MAASTPSSQCRRNNQIQRPNQAASPMNMLPKELVIEILSRLPPKSFFRCKAVCKSWLSLFSDALHLNKHLQPPLAGLFCTKFNNEGTCFLEFSCDDDADKTEAEAEVEVEVDKMIRTLSSYDCLKIRDCCNGLLLIEAFNENAMTIRDMHVYNPATRALFNVWSFTKPFNTSIYKEAFSLAFDTRVHDSIFHIVCFISWMRDGKTSSFMDIFSFERGKCTSEKELVYDTMINFDSRGTYVDGRVYRVTCKNEILSIDPKECSYQVIQKPDFENNDALIEVGQQKGRLHCLSLCDKKKSLLIWVLESVTPHKWILKHRLSIHHLYSVPRPLHYDLRTHFAFHPYADIVFFPVGRDGLILLNLSTGDRHDLDNVCRRHFMASWTYTPCYLI